MPWLFLLASWIVAIIAVAFGYGFWNRAGLRAHVAARSSRPAPGSPLEDLPEQILRTAPLPAPVFEGDVLVLDIGLDTSGAARGPARLTGFIGGERVTAATSLVPRSGWRHEVALPSVRRGPVGARGWVVETTDPAGLFRGTRAARDVEVALVLPRFASLTASPAVRELEASVAAPRAGSGNELFGVREYRPGDSLRRIHWRSSARHGELVVREYEPPGVRTLAIFCDPEPPSPEVADQVARLAASEAWDCLRGGGRVVLWGPRLEPSLPGASRSFWALLEWLARYPTVAGTGLDADPPVAAEAVAVTGGANAGVIDALQTVRCRGGEVRAWVVGDAEIEVDGPVRHVGTEWPL